MPKIAVTGPESTGKSALCQALAQHYRTVWVPEFARGYLQDRQAPYTSEDLDNIAKGQANAAERVRDMTGDPVFYDTEMTVMKIWSEHALGYCTPTIRQLYQNQHYDLYLLMDIDLPWEPDPLREHPHLRAYFFGRYHEELSLAGRHFKVISGIGENRVGQAIRVVDGLLSNA